MNRPKMILFDYGNTLVYEPEWDILKGLKALWPYVMKNPTGITAEMFEPYAYEAVQKSWECTQKGYEIPDHLIMRGAFAPFGLEFRLNDYELEELYFEEAIPGFTVPGAEAILELCRNKNIRTAVVSNLSFDGRVLENRLKKLFPDHRFEFVFASSAFFFRKPNPHMHKAALLRSGLAPEDIWFIGDNYYADIETSHSLGMTPVWITTGLPNFYPVRKPPEDIPFDVTHVRSMTEIIRMLETL